MKWTRLYDPLSHTVSSQRTATKKAFWPKKAFFFSYLSKPNTWDSSLFGILSLWSTYLTLTPLQTVKTDLTSSLLQQTGKYLNVFKCHLNWGWQRWRTCRVSWRAWVWAPASNIKPRCLKFRCVGGEQVNHQASYRFMRDFSENTNKEGRKWVKKVRQPASLSGLCGQVSTYHTYTR